MPNPNKRSATADGGGPEYTYFNYLRAGNWRVPRCRACQKIAFYPRIHCVACGGETFDWIEPSRGGTVYATTVMRRPAEAGGDQHLCLVDLDDGFRMMSRVVTDRPEAVRVGDRVSAFVETVGDVPLVVFLHEKEAA